jgi:tetratricopeptide (TPR) repeat protein
MGSKPVIAAAAFALFSLAAFAETSPFPIRRGTEWILARDGGEQHVVIESLSDIQTSAGPIHTALLRRSDGSDRIVVRTEDTWIECEPKRTADGRATCDQPLIFLAWPLEIGKKWASGGFEFSVVSKEAVATPLQTFPEAWKIFYTTQGSSDPLGELWIAEGFGRIRIREGNYDFLLSSFDPGKEANLAVSPAKAVEAFFNPENSISFQLPPPKKWSSFMLALRGTKLLPLVLFQTVITIVVFVFGIGIWRSLKSQQHGGSPKDEARLLSLLGRDGSLNDAEQRLLEMVRQFPLYPDLRHHLAQIQKAVGKSAEARKNWEEAIRLNGNYVDARIALAQLLLDLGEPKFAAEHFRVVTTLKPKFADAQLGLGSALFQLGDFGPAKEALMRCLEINPALSDAKHLLDECRNMSHG